jgi:hypothetical protein
MKRISDRSGVIPRPREPVLDVLTAYSVDVVVRRRRGPDGLVGGARRGSVMALSRASRSRLVLTARNSEPLRWFLTLTYPAAFPGDGRTTKRHLHVFLKRLRRAGARGLWWLEFQRRGAPHFHLAVTGGRFGEAGDPPMTRAELAELRSWVSRAWYEVVGSGDRRHLKAGTNLEEWRSGRHGLQEYVTKESAKWVQKAVPEGFEDVGRFWALFGGAKVLRVEVREAPRASLAAAVRVARGSERAERRRRGFPRRRDAGVVGFTAYGAGGAVARFLREAT